MEKPDPHGEWVLFATNRGAEGNALLVDEELLAAAPAAWPHILAHTRRELGGKNLEQDAATLAADTWEQVLRSVSKTRLRKRDHHPPIADFQSYLIGVFHHRFNRLLKKEQKRTDTIELFASALDLERLESARDADWVSELERAITVRKIINQMDNWTKKVWQARQYGFSWQEIAERLGISEQQAKMKYRYGLDKVRQRFLTMLKETNPDRPKKK